MENQSRERKRAVPPTSSKKQQPVALPMAYLITFSCYGTWLHGNEAGSVDRKHNVPFTDQLPSDQRRLEAEQNQLRENPYAMDERRRRIVLQSLLEVCLHRGWVLLAAHVRTTYVHAVVHALEAPEKIMSDLKAWASRKLNETGIDPERRKRWTRHGSTKYLWQPSHVEAAITYVISEQGEPMAVFEEADHSLPARLAGSEPRT